MIKIKLYEPEIHRNECTLLPFAVAKNSLHDIGLKFTTGDSYDYAWIAQASIMDQNVSYEESLNKGLDFLSKITGDYMIIDGQDSTSLMYTYDVFKQSKALLLLKNSLLKDRNLYKQGSAYGRNYWGDGNFKIDDIDIHLDKIKISGTNWLSTHWAGINSRQMYPINRPREYDVSAMFQYPSTKQTETSVYYDAHRKNAIDILNTLPISIAKLNNGERVSIEEYYTRQFSSKIIIAPYGYGEMAPRDIEAILFGNILIKPDMSHIETAPDIFEDMKTYVACKHDYSDLPEKIDMILGNYEYYSYIIENARKTLIEKMHPNNLALHLYNIFNEL
jgi:hypothetical protein